MRAITYQFKNDADRAVFDAILSEIGPEDCDEVIAIYNNRATGLTLEQFDTLKRIVFKAAALKEERETGHPFDMEYDEFKSLIDLDDEEDE